MSQPYSELIVGSDGSRTASRAVEATGRLAARLEVPVTVLTSWYRELRDPPVASEESRYPGGTARGTEAMWAAKAAADAAGIARAAGAAEVHQATPTGGAADALLAFANERPGALLVVGTVGLADRSERLLGNVPHQLTHHATRDVLLIRSSRDDHDWRGVALATDGSPTAAMAVERGARLAHALGVTPTLLAASSDQADAERRLDHAAADLPDALPTDRRAVVGDEITRTLLDAAADMDLLVLGNKGMSGPSRLLGSVANRITHEVPCDLLLVNTTR